MSFKVYPDPSIGPLVVGPHQPSPPQRIEEIAASAPAGRTVFLRTIMLGDGGQPPSKASAPDPTFQLQVNEGKPVVLGLDYAFVNGKEGQGVGKAMVSGTDQRIYGIKIVIAIPGGDWQLIITNNGNTPRRFTWVVADQDDQADQPWLNLPPALSFDYDINKPVPRLLKVANLGTGNLNIRLSQIADGSDFQMVPPPGDIAPNTCGDLVITFKGSSKSAPTRALYIANSNDSQATQSPHHNDRIKLTATPKTPKPPDGDTPAKAHPCGSCRCANYVGDWELHTGPCKNSKCGHSRNSHRA